MRRRAVAAALVMVVVLTAAGCEAAPGERRVRVFAAASLRSVLTDAADEYARATGVEVVLSFGASSTLRAQIEHGAPADLFLSADRRNAELLAQALGTAAQPRPFAVTPLVIAVPAGDPADIADWRELARGGLRIIGAAEEVPIQAYAGELVRRLGNLPGAPAGFTAAVERNTLSQEDNARAVLARLELAEGDAAIVYAADATRSTGVEILPLPAVARVEARYEALVVGRSAEGERLLAWLTGPDGERVMAWHGYDPP